MATKRDLLNQTFGRLTVIAEAAIAKNGSAMWECLCECGNNTTVLSSNLLYGFVISCGCYRRERVGKASTTHGKTNTRQYKTHMAMMQRCYSVSDYHYPNYGGRGITVCERWHDVHNYIADIALLPGTGNTIERIDNAREYSPMNCRKATHSEQQRNKRNNVLDELKVIAIKHLLCAGCRNVDIAEALGVSADNVRSVKHGRTWADVSIDISDVAYNS